MPTPRHGNMVVARIGGEYHVLFQPDDLPHHFLSVARFQDRGRAASYAEIEGLWVDDEGTQQADALGLAAIADPKAPAPGKVEPTPQPRSATQPAPAPPAEKPSLDSALPPDSTPEPPAGAPPAPRPVVDAERSSADRPVAAAIPARAAEASTLTPTPAAKPLPPAMAEAKERALDHYAEHGGSQAEVAARTGVPPGSLSGFMSVARKDGDPRIAAGDAKRAMTPHLARVIGATVEKPGPARPSRPAEPPKPVPSVILADKPRPKAPEPVIPPAPAGRPRTQAEMVEAAKRAVPAPTFSRPGGASVRTG